jgi:cell fate (sporulation/competence/biofilm development) regulator YlbF (YheA/YmcA/DUF963 family)
MCIKIIGEREQEFNPNEPLEEQVVGANEIVVSYDPTDPKIDSFVGQMERIIKNGISCKVDIRVNANNCLNGMRLERQLDKLKLKLDMNEVVKGLTKFHADIDHRLNEISAMCVEKINE